MNELFKKEYTEAEEKFQTELKHTEATKKMESKFSAANTITNNKTE